jgi:hypothetical protein
VIAFAFMFAGLGFIAMGNYDLGWALFAVGAAILFFKETK